MDYSPEPFHIKAVGPIEQLSLSELHLRLARAR